MARIAPGTSSLIQTSKPGRGKAARKISRVARPESRHGHHGGRRVLEILRVQLEEFPGWESDDDDDSDDDSEEDNGPEPIQTEYVAIGTWYMTEADL